VFLCYPATCVLCLLPGHLCSVPATWLSVRVAGASLPGRLPRATLLCASLCLRWCWSCALSATLSWYGCRGSFGIQAQAVGLMFVLFPHSFAYICFVLPSHLYIRHACVVCAAWQSACIVLGALLPRGATGSCTGYAALWILPGATRSSSCQQAGTGWALVVWWCVTAQPLYSPSTRLAWQQRFIVALAK
jgi:hypothetical protein